MSWIIIDGYNLIPVLGCKDREALLKTLSAYASTQNKHTLTVVFDATFAGDSLPYRTAFGGVEVIYSPITQNADSLIDEMLSDSKRKNILVISSDRAVQKSATQWGQQFMECKDFSQQLLRKTNAVDSDSQMPFLRVQTRDSKPQKRGGNPRKLSKKEKEKRKLIKKI